MTDPELPSSDAACELLMIFSALTRLDHRGVSAWAASWAACVMDHLAQAEMWPNVFDDDPVVPLPLATLSEAEVRGLTEWFADAARSFHPDAQVAMWCRQLVGLLLVEPDRRRVDAVMVELQLQQHYAEMVTPTHDADVATIPPWSAVSGPAENTPPDQR